MTLPSLVAPLVVRWVQGAWNAALVLSLPTAQIVALGPLSTLEALILNDAEPQVSFQTPQVKLSCKYSNEILPTHPSERHIRLRRDFHRRLHLASVL